MNHRSSRRLLNCSLLLAPLLWLISASAWADSTTDNASLLSQNLDTVATIFNDMSILFGVCMFVGALSKFKKCAEGRSMASGQASMATPCLMILAGVCFMMLPEVIDSSLLSFWGSYIDPTSPDAGSTEPWAAYEPIVLQFVRLIGVGSFMRCLFLMVKAGHQGGQPGQGGKALMHFFAALLCVHIQGTMELINSFFGIN